MIETNLENLDAKRERAIRKLSSVYNLPSLPFIILEVNKIIDDPRTSASQLGKMISQDQGLVTKILTVANSPLYGIPKRVSTIDFAIVILGFNQIKNIVIALSMMETLKRIGDEKFNHKKYWQHSVITASAAKRIADDLGYQFSGEAFTAGLLHDLGIPIIYKYFNKEYKEIIAKVASNKSSYLDVELDLLGLTHQEIGMYLLERWNLPLSLSEAVAFHHNPSDAEHFPELTAIIHLADYMTQKLEIGTYFWDDNIQLDKNIITILRLGDEEYLENFIDSYKELFQYQIETLDFQ